eukprot:COSAG01_NODE_64240_length_277_cov_0.775281_1_plen_37_part_10
MSASPASDAKRKWLGIEDCGSSASNVIDDWYERPRVS